MSQFRATQNLASPWLRKLKKLSRSEDFVVYDNLAFQAEVKWATVSGARVIVEAHAQALVSTGTASIKDLIQSTSQPFGDELHYLRADFEPENLGAVLHDAVPHVHSRQKHEPRFPMSLTRSLPHVDFIELIHRNFFPEQWAKWADEVWAHHGWKGQWGGQGDPHARIKAAFKQNQTRAIMEDYAEPVRFWKRLLRKEKMQMCPLKWHEPYEVLGY